MQLLAARINRFTRTAALSSTPEPLAAPRSGHAPGEGAEKSPSKLAVYRWTLLLRLSPELQPRLAEQSSCR
jgi:hypothetical protein